MKEKQLGNDDQKDTFIKTLYGIDPEMSLLSVDFATTENLYLNEDEQDIDQNNE
ncbi:hypothetical protein ACQKCU_04545 [Heyndrickxia sporothermodurans]